MDDASQNGDTDTYNTLQEQMEAVNKKLAEVDTNLHAVDTAKKRVEALEDIKNTLNKAGLKEDIMAKVLLSEKFYKRLINQPWERSCRAMVMYRKQPEIQL